MKRVLVKALLMGREGSKGSARGKFQPFLAKEGAGVISKEGPKARLHLDSLPRGSENVIEKFEKPFFEVRGEIPFGAK